MSGVGTVTLSQDTSTVTLTFETQTVTLAAPGPLDDQDAIHDNVDGEIAAITLKSAPLASGDLLLIEDSAASNAKKRTTVADIQTGVTDADAIHDNVAAEISAVTAKTTVDKDDLLLLEDSEAGNAKKSIEVENLLSQPFGSIGAENQGTAISLPTQSVYVQYDQFEFNGPSSRCTPDHTADEITIDENGTYLILVSVAAEMSVASTESYQWAIHKNGFVEATLTNRQTMAGLNDRQSVSISGHLALVAGDVIDLRVRCYTAGSVSIRGRDANLSVVRIGP